MYSRIRNILWSNWSVFFTFLTEPFLPLLLLKDILLVGSSVETGWLFCSKLLSLLRNSWLILLDNWLHSPSLSPFSFTPDTPGSPHFSIKFWMLFFWWKVCVYPLRASRIRLALVVQVYSRNHFLHTVWLCHSVHCRQFDLHPARPRFLHTAVFTP